MANNQGQPGHAVQKPTTHGTLHMLDYRPLILLTSIIFSNFICLSAFRSKYSIFLKSVRDVVEACLRNSCDANNNVDELFRNSATNEVLPSNPFRCCC